MVEGRNEWRRMSTLINIERVEFGTIATVPQLRRTGSVTVRRDDSLILPSGTRRQIGCSGPTRLSHPTWEFSSHPQGWDFAQQDWRIAFERETVGGVEIKFWTPIREYLYGLAYVSGVEYIITKTEIDDFDEAVEQVIEWRGIYCEAENRRIDLKGVLPSFPFGYEIFCLGPVRCRKVDSRNQTLTTLQKATALTDPQQHRTLTGRYAI